MVDAPQPPIHMRCRCFLQPVFNHTGLKRYLAREEQNVRVARIDTQARTVKHRDGTISTNYTKLRVKHPPAKMNYQQWLSSMVKSKNPADVNFAKEVLGPTRFELVKSDKLKIKSLYYAGRLRTIKQLRRLI